MGIDLKELATKFENLEKIVEAIDKRKIHCEKAREKIYSRLSFLEKNEARKDERLKNLEDKLDTIKEILENFQREKNKVMYDIMKFLLGSLVGAAISLLLKGVVLK